MKCARDTKESDWDAYDQCTEKHSADTEGPCDEFQAAAEVCGNWDAYDQCTEKLSAD